MALRRRQPGIVRYYFGKWPAMERGPVVESDAHRLLTDQMQAYLKGEVRGRSFLIAGHRGAGKTFLIRNAAERIYLELFKKEYKELLTPVSSAAGKGVRNPSLRDVQRPLFVQIHGPSLLGRRGEVAHLISPPEEQFGQHHDKRGSIEATCYSQLHDSLIRTEL